MGGIFLLADVPAHLPDQRPKGVVGAVDGGVDVLPAVYLQLPSHQGGIEEEHCVLVSSKGVVIVEPVWGPAIFSIKVCVLTKTWWYKENKIYYRVQLECYCSVPLM